MTCFFLFSSYGRHIKVVWEDKLQSVAFVNGIVTLGVILYLAIVVSIHTYIQYIATVVLYYSLLMHSKIMEIRNC